jgi:hypothetical protein
MKKKKYLNFYKRCMKTGWMPKDGLCNNFPTSTLLKRFDIDGTCAGGYWGHTGESFYNDPLFRSTPYYWHQRESSFSTLRQTVVLLMAAQKGEL